MANILAGLIMVTVVIVFWVQRGYTSQYGGLFPDPVMIALGVLGLVLAGLGITRRTTGAEEDAEARLPWAGLARAVGILIAWVASLTYLGYLVGGAVFFLGMALLMRTERPTAKAVALDAVVAVAVVGLFYLVFTQLLTVRLPELAF